MSNQRNASRSLSTSNPVSRGLAGAVQRAARVSGRHPKSAIALWLMLIVGLVAAGSAVGMRELSATDAGVGESGEAERALADAGLRDPAVESVLVTADDPAVVTQETAALARAVESLRGVESVAEDSLVADRGRARLLQVTLRGDVDNAAPVQAVALNDRIERFAEGHPTATFEQTGAASLDGAIDEVVADDLAQVEMFSLPLILGILFLAFGALVAASVPLVLGITAVAGALGAASLVSQFAPDSGTTASLVVLIGLAVGVDYSLFYIRREREERKLGKGTAAALDASAATVGRAVVVSGVTVIIALAGLLVTGLAVFTSLALGTMIVVLLAVIGSITVLPAMLSLLGERIERGRIPFTGRIRARLARRNGPGFWGRVTGLVTAHPLASFVTSAAILATLAVPAFGMHLGETTAEDLPRDVPAVAALNHVEDLFPGAPEEVNLIVEGENLGAPDSRAELAELGALALDATGGEGDTELTIADGGAVAEISVPMPDMDRDAADAVVERIRDDVAPAMSGVSVRVSGEAAESLDFTVSLRESMPIVVGIVLALAFVLLLAAFRSWQLALSVIGLNLLSVGAAYGVVTAVFQHGWGESLLGFTSNGAIVPWIPLFSFVILFGLSMDYTVIVLERIREARMAGKSAREAAAEGVAATAGAVTSAAVVMVAVFSLFAMLRLPEMKQLGVGLGAAILIDATLVRGVALPAVVTLLGERRWRVRPQRRRRPRPAALSEDRRDAILVSAHES